MERGPRTLAPPTATAAIQARVANAATALDPESQAPTTTARPAAAIPADCPGGRARSAEPMSTDRASAVTGAGSCGRSAAADTATAAAATASPAIAVPARCRSRSSAREHTTTPTAASHTQ
ncbi:hypothetical protein ACIHCQ_34895 [Streptomyces sp. NPDC052236]|uniref:hypothetical protein n=1 Tax=Streptomyces sp. NPDC052236 TaxID=3365686 RepID=UPI0037D47CCB